MDTRLQEHIEQNLSRKYALDDNEWVDIYITPLNRVDITIVSDKAETIEEKSIVDEVSGLINHYDGIIPGKYSIGFIELYTVDDAEDLGIRKTEIKKAPITWSDIININKQKVERDSRDGAYKVISFYSYKGGVGRTIAMIQVAYLLAEQGRRVLLVDLDIEAPSLHTIFKDQINDATYGVKHGLVDYLFDKMMNPFDKDQTIKTTELFCELKFDEPVSGSIYILPSTKQLDQEYIYKLTQLQTNIIYENRYLEDLLKALEKEINIDTVLIDSRTGLNQWGAFSLLGFADQIIFIAYPNKENIEGINAVVRMMKGAGLENYVVAMSKVVASTEGQRFSNALFGKLDIEQEISIDIPYDPAIAMADTFPAVNVVEPYKGLSNFILEKDDIDFNTGYLTRANRQVLIEKMFMEKNVNIFTDSEVKAVRDSNYNVVIYHKESDLNKLYDISNKSFVGRYGRSIIIQDEDGRRILYRKRMVPIWQFSMQPALIDSFIKAGTSNWTIRWFAFILYVINEQSKDERNKNLLNGIGELKEKDFEAYIEYLAQYPDGAMIEKIKQSLFSKTRGFPLDNEEGDIGQLFEKTIGQAVSIFIDIPALLNQSSEAEWLPGLIDVIKVLKKSIPDLRMVATTNPGIYERYEKEFADLKGSVIHLDWSEKDIETLLTSNINPGTFEDYSKELTSKVHILDKVNMDEANMDEKISIDFAFSRELELRVLSLIIGKRRTCGKYSEPMISWLGKQLKRLPSISCEIVIDILKHAADEGHRNGTKAADRLIDMDSISQAVDKYLRIAKI